MSVVRKAVITTIVLSGILVSVGVCADSRLLWSTFFGGTGNDAVNAIAVDSRGYVYIAGMTSSDDFPTLKALQANRAKSNCGNPGYRRPCFDLFLAKFTPGGTDLLYSTFWGGSGNDVATGLSIDRSDNVYLIGATTSKDFPVSNSQEGLSGNQDVFVLKLNRSGELIFSKLIGGEGSEWPSSIATDDNGNSYIAGDTDSLHFPTVGALGRFGGLTDAFIMKMGPRGDIVRSRYLGGRGIDIINSIKVRKNGDIFVGGYTDSTNFPVRNGWPTVVTEVSDGFLTKINGQAWTIEFSTRLGGNGYDEVKAIALIPDGGVIV